LALGTTDKGTFNTATFFKHDPVISALTKLYAFVQFLVVTSIALFFLEGGNFTYEQTVGVFILIVFTMFCVAKWLDGFKIIAMEVFRLALLIIVSFYIFLQDEYLLSAILVSYVFLNLAYLFLLARREPNFRS